MEQTLTAAVTLASLFLYLVFGVISGRTRSRSGLAAPAMVGNLAFERAHRVHMNTLEQMMFFLPSLWLCAFLFSDKAAAIGGVVWICARIFYAISYRRDPAARHPAFIIGMLAQLGLFLCAAWAWVSAFAAS